MHFYASTLKSVSSYRKSLRFLLLPPAFAAVLPLFAQQRPELATQGGGSMESYEKGIDVLTASQSYQAALESSRLGHGYLTYALVEEGLALADTTPVDGKITAPEWFEYASSRVPQLQIAALGESNSSGRQLTFESGLATQSQQQTQQGTSRLQTPRFYYRRDTLKMENIIAVQP